jgi:predicted transcriptional regulator
MTLIIELPPELERQLQDAAARSGQAPAVLAQAAVAEKLAALAQAEQERRARILAMIDRWDAEDEQRIDGLPAPEIPRLSLRVPDLG